MTATIETTEPSTPSPAALRLAEGVELLGRVEGSGLREAPYLVRRPDGQVVQLSRLLYRIARHARPGTDLAAIASRAGADLDVRITPDQVSYVLEGKLQPLGVVADRDGAPPAPRRIDPILALKLRVGVVPPALVGRVASALAPLFRGPVVLTVLGVLAAFDVWMVLSGGIGDGLRRVIDTPVLTLLLFGLAYVSLAWHELGHAAACRFGGARPGAIGVGLYIVWPVMYTDVTESYRFDRRGRLRVDLGGIYFNLLFALATGVAYLLTGFAPLLLVVLAQHLMVLDQFVPWIRLDGYYVVSDLIGVSDLYTRIVPVLRSLVRPGREPDARVAELRPWALCAVTAWVLTTIAALLGGLTLLVIHSPAYVERAWMSLLAQGRALGDGSIVEALAAGVGIVTLLLPVLAVVVSYVLLCGGAGRRLALHATCAHGG